MSRAVVSKALVQEISKYRESRLKGSHEACVHHLGRAHIISQGRWFHHLYVHVLMMEYAWARRDYREFYGQILRAVVTIPGHLLGRVPVGNIGWSTVGLMEKMPIPKDLVSLLGKSSNPKDGKGAVRTK